MKKSTIIAIVVAAAAVAGYLAYNRITAWHRGSLNNALEQERARALQEKNALEQEAGSLQAELDQYKDTLVSRDRLKDVFGDNQPLSAPEGKPLTCPELEAQITGFFNYLESKDYGTTCKLPGKPFDLFREMIKQLTDHVPSVNDETATIDSLMSNMTFFYRILGRKRLACIRSIIQNETEMIEPVASSLYSWLSSGDCCAQTMTGCPPMEVRYEYAAFFLNTLAGRSYLMRRDATLRTLVTYYSLLIIDGANDTSLNRHGIDLRPHIELVHHEISNHRGLLNKKQYLAKLDMLAEKYGIDRDS